VFVIREVYDVFTVCMVCIMVGSISVPYICLLLRQNFFSIREDSCNLHSMVLNIISNLEHVDDIMFLTCGQVDILKFVKIQYEFC
jgi:hypothetical protein